MLIQNYNLIVLYNILILFSSYTHDLPIVRAEHHAKSCTTVLCLQTFCFFVGIGSRLHFLRCSNWKPCLIIQFNNKSNTSTIRFQFGFYFGKLEFECQTRE